MKLILIAFFLSISFHFLFIFSFMQKPEPKKNIQNKEEIKKTTEIKYVKLKKKPEAKKIEPKKELKKPNIKKQKVQKPKIEKKTKKSVKKKTVQKKLPKKQLEKSKKLQNKILKNQIVNKEKSIQNKTLEDFLSQRDSKEEKMTSQVERLYGREFETFTKVQKAFIKKNLNTFQAITQRVLNQMGYPYIAREMRISGINQVSFIFHPNGDISNLKITNSSGYSVFDDYSLELIKIAYKDYPRPKSATKLIFNVQYRLY